MSMERTPLLTTSDSREVDIVCHDEEEQFRASEPPTPSISTKRSSRVIENMLLTALYTFMVVASVQMVVRQYPSWFTSYKPKFDYLFPIEGWLRTITSVCLPIHMVFAPLSLFGGLFQVATGWFRIRKLHKRTGPILVLVMYAALVSSLGLSIGSLARESAGYQECLNLLFLACYTGTCVTIAVWHVKNHRIMKHQHFMMRAMAGWFVFVTYRWVVYSTQGNYILAGLAMLATLSSAEVVICLLLSFDANHEDEE